MGYITLMHLLTHLYSLPQAGTLPLITPMPGISLQ